MSTSKKARVSCPADEEMEWLWGKNGGSVLCDGLANSLKTTRNKTGYKHVYPQRRSTYSFQARVQDIKVGKEVCLGSFHTAYAAAVTAALSKTKGLQDRRDATLTSRCLTEQAEQVAKQEGLTLGSNPSLASRFTNVFLQNKESTLRPFMIRSALFRSMPSGIARSYTSAGHAALMIARHDKA